MWCEHQALWAASCFVQFAWGIIKNCGFRSQPPSCIKDFLNLNGAYQWPDLRHPCKAPGQTHTPRKSAIFWISGRNIWTLPWWLAWCFACYWIISLTSTKPWKFLEKLFECAKWNFGVLELWKLTRISIPKMSPKNTRSGTPHYASIKKDEQHKFDSGLWVWKSCCFFVGFSFA